MVGLASFRAFIFQPELHLNPLEPGCSVGGAESRELDVLRGGGSGDGGVFIVGHH